MNIFATVGTQLPFDRMMMALNLWAAAHPDQTVIAQTGRTSHSFSHLTCVEAMDQTAFATAFAKADVVVAHAGMGTILSACEMGKPLLLMPRRAILGEHRNDHQIDTAEKMSALANVTVVHGPLDLTTELDRLLADPAAAVPGPSHASTELIANLGRFIFQTRGKERL